MIWPEEWWFKSLEIQRLRDVLRTDGEHATIGIWDTGLDNSQRLIDLPRLSGRNYLPGGDPKDIRDRSSNRHGSEVARIIAGKKDCWGIAPAAQLIIAKAVSDGGDKAYLEAFDPGGGFGSADIINVSYGYRKDQDRHTATIAGFEKRLKGDQRLIVAAMGNFGARLITYPAAIRESENILGVGAVGANGELYSGSVDGPGLDLCAPGMAVQGYFTNKPLVGTSFASAIVSGVCALVYSALVARHGSATGEQVAQLVLSCTTRPTGTGSYGNGILNTRRIIERLSS